MTSLGEENGLLLVVGTFLDKDRRVPCKHIWWGVCVGEEEEIFIPDPNMRESNADEQKQFTMIVKKFA